MIIYMFVKSLTYIWKNEELYYYFIFINSIPHLIKDKYT